MARLGRFAAGVGVIAAIAALTLACGDDDGERGSEDDLKERVEAFFEAFRDDPPRESYAFYRERCRNRYSLTEYTATVATARAFFEGFLNIKLEDLEVEDVEVIDLTDTSADVRMVLRTKDGDDPFEGGEDEPQEWVYEDGEWYAANCSDLSIQSEDNDDSGATPPANTPRAGGSATATTVPTVVEIPKIGETTESKGGKYRVNAVRDNLPGDDFNKPPAGKRWVAFDITIEAVAPIEYNPFDYSVQDADAFVYESDFASVQDPTPRLSSGELAAGGVVRGWVFFEVPAEAKLTTVRVETDFGAPVVVIADLRQQ